MLRKVNGNPIKREIAKKQVRCIIVFVANSTSYQEINLKYRFESMNLQIYELFTDDDLCK